MRTLQFACIAIVASLAIPEASFAQGGMTVCRPGGPCVRTSAAAYNRCVDRALHSGQDLSRGDRYSFDQFMYACVAGRTTR
jgi:hypothetical protein